MHWSCGSMLLFALVLSSNLFNQVTLKPYYFTTTDEDNRDVSSDMQVASPWEDYQEEVVPKKVHLRAPNIGHIQTGLDNMSLEEKKKWAEEMIDQISNSSSEWTLLDNYLNSIDSLLSYLSIQKFAQTKMAQARLDLQAGEAGAEGDLSTGELLFRDAKDRGDAFQKLATVQENKLKNYYKNKLKNCYYKEGAKNAVGAVSGIVASLSGAYALGCASKAAWDYLFRNGSVTSESTSNSSTLVPTTYGTETTVILENFLNFRVICAILAVLVVLCIGGTLLANRFGLFNRLAVQEGETPSTGETGSTHSTNSSNGATLSKKAPSKKATHSNK